ncbi:energy-coupled thiamine transporter ThiT [Clostridium sp. MSJ-11]|uniref:Energy-coupled thiamine transporter ThiT n=1 Tax=Clostridium mobile TaxID=2841512 RepID=A0ABS6EGH9_9CLOT|nr:energy-coupled thiamine transporter ThiT [Clostridium mobile]MBU5484257.1 energy-coupled thiamine transporter ThiT [Clostridium mobile]
MPEFNSEVLKEFLEFKPVTLVILTLLILLSIMGLKKKNETKFSIKMLVYGSLCISLSFVLSYMKLFSWPQGGSITPASMLPIMVFSSMFGAIPSIIVGTAYGLLQFIQDPYIVHWAQVFLDFPLAFGAIGLAGLFRNNLVLSSLAGGLGRMFFHFLSGVIFFGSYAPAGMHPAIYSLSVNGLLIGTETVICIAVSLLPQIKSATRRIAREITA